MNSLLLAVEKAAPLFSDVTGFIIMVVVCFCGVVHMVCFTGGDGNTSPKIACPDCQSNRYAVEDNGIEGKFWHCPDCGRTVPKH